MLSDAGGRHQGQTILERKDLSLSSVTRKLSPAGMKPVEPAVVGAHLSNGSNGSSGATDHIKRVPQPKSLRERLRRQAAVIAGRLDPAAAATKAELDSLARELLADLKLPEAYVGWTMVMLATAFWQPKVASVQHDRRLLLLPGKLRIHAMAQLGRSLEKLKKGTGTSRPCQKQGDAERVLGASPLFQHAKCQFAPRVALLGCGRWPRNWDTECCGPKNRSRC